MPMCGICGVLTFNDSFACDERLVAAMRDTMAHRGPDDGVWRSTGGRVALGHRRQSIVDAFNGEIYKHAKLRVELETRGHRYRSHCDTETIVDVAGRVNV